MVFLFFNSAVSLSAIYSENKKEHKKYLDEEAMNSVGFSAKEFCYQCQIRCNLSWGVEYQVKNNTILVFKAKS